MAAWVACLGPLCGTHARADGRAGCAPGGVLQGWQAQGKSRLRQARGAPGTAAWRAAPAVGGAGVPGGSGGGSLQGLSRTDTRDQAPGGPACLLVNSHWAVVPGPSRTVLENGILTNPPPPPLCADNPPTIAKQVPGIKDMRLTAAGMRSALCAHREARLPVALGREQLPAQRRHCLAQAAPAAAAALAAPDPSIQEAAACIACTGGGSMSAGR